jgi:cystathionine gamma-synthase
MVQKRDDGMNENGRQKARRLSESTKAVHAGVKRPYSKNSLTMPIFQTAAFTFEDTRDLTEFMSARIWGLQGDRIEYGRYGNPTIAAVESKIAALEGAEDAVLFSSGMAAITSTLLTILSTGDHVILTDDCYRRTRQFCDAYLERLGIGCTIIPAGDSSALEAAVSPDTKLIISELPTNPYLRVIDLQKLVDVASSKGIHTAIDNTFATPINLQPAVFGVDLIFHSATKYLGGHNDLLAGAVVGSASQIAMIRQNQWMMGAVSDAHTAFLLDRGLKTLAVRVRHQNRTAQAISEFLETHPNVTRVWYPGLDTHPDHTIASEQMRGFGGVVSFEVEGDLDAASRCVDAVEMPIIAPSFGGTETLIEQPALMSYFELTTEERLEIGIKDNLIRLSVGLEDTDDLIEDLDRGLSAV